MFLMLNSHATFYVSYLGFNYVNTIGFLLICLYMIQLLSGLQLSLYYNYSLSYYAFDSIQFIMKDVNIGNIIRIFHIIGSSFYMLFLWLHLLRGLFIKLFFYSFISSVNSPQFSLSTAIVCEQSSQSFHSLKDYMSLLQLERLNYFLDSCLYSSLGLVRLIYFSYGFESIFHFSFVNSFYFTFYYVYFIGIIIFLVSIPVSFIGYTLVFGNLSYYGVIVVLGIISSVPSLLSYLIQFFFLFFSFLLILFIIVFLFIV